MKHMVSKLVCLATVVAGVSFGAQAYEDEFISVDDETVVKKEVDGHAVYVFATPTELARKLTLLQPMVLDQYLVVGGGGAGGNVVGGGGGGGGVVYDGAAAMVVGNGTVLSVFVGAGGKRGDTGEIRQGANSTLTLPGVGVVTAYGGGGGNSWNGGQGLSGASTGGATSNGGGGVRPVVDVDPPQGNPGGACASGGSGLGGGGGGYSEPGQASYSAKRDILDEDGNVLIENQSYMHGGKGGDGFPCAITGERHVYGSGGGGAAGWANAGGINVYNLPGEGAKSRAVRADTRRSTTATSTFRAEMAWRALAAAVAEPGTTTAWA